MRDVPEKAWPPAKVRNQYSDHDERLARGMRRRLLQEITHSVAEVPGWACEALPWYFSENYDILHAKSPSDLDSLSRQSPKDMTR